MKVRSKTYLQKLKGTYYFRRPIPPELQHLFRGRKALRWSLSTKDRATAEHRCELDTVKTTAQFAKASGRVTISDGQADLLIAQMLASRLGADVEQRVTGAYVEHAEYQRHLDALSEMESATTVAVARGKVDGIKEQALDCSVGRVSGLIPPHRTFSGSLLASRLR